MQLTQQNSESNPMLLVKSKDMPTKLESQLSQQTKPFFQQTHSYQQPETKKPFVIYSRPLAGYLLSNYCELLRVVPSIQNPTKKVYMFEDTQKLHQLMEDFKTQQDQQKQQELE